MWILTAIGILPAVIFVVVQQTKTGATGASMLWPVPLLVIVFVVYTYIWIFALVAAACRLLLGRDDWVKTARVAHVSAD